MCEGCGCRYAAVGAAFFCPSCGHNSARTAFAETLAVIRKLPQVRVALDAGLDRDAAANTYRLILEENMSKIVAAFQCFAEATFESLSNATKGTPRRNLFQSLSESSDLWERVIGQRYEAMLSPVEWQLLLRYFQQRHLLAHKDGLVDQAYIEKSGDTTYRPGQRLVVKETDILRFAMIIESLAKGLTTACNQSESPKDT